MPMVNMMLIFLFRHTDNGDGYQVVVYSKEDAKKWDIVDPTSVDKENKTMEVALDDGALFSVVADAE